MTITSEASPPNAGYLHVAAEPGSTLAHRAGNRTARYIRHEPVKSVAIAAAVGAAAAALVHLLRHPLRHPPR